MAVFSIRGLGVFGTRAKGPKGQTPTARIPLAPSSGRTLARNKTVHGANVGT